METRKVEIHVTRNYYKSVIVKVEVDKDIKGEALQKYLSHDNEIDNEIEKALGDYPLQGSDTEYLYTDKENNDGGHL